MCIVDPSLNALWEPRAISSELYGQKYPWLFWVPPHFLEFAPPHFNPGIPSCYNSRYGYPKLHPASSRTLARGRKCSHLVSVFSLSGVTGHFSHHRYLGHSSCFRAFQALVWWTLEMDASWPIGEWIQEAEYSEKSPWPESHSLLDSLIAPSHRSPARWWLGLASVWQASNPGLATSCAVPWSYKPENCWGLWPGPFHSPTPCSQPRSNLFLSVACVLFFFSTSIIYSSGI